MDWPRGDGEMASRIRAFDWSTTPLGAIGEWPPRLRAVVDLMLASVQPACIAWGPALISLYNDGYIAVAGDRHPHALGQPYHRMGPAIWDEFRAVADAVMAGEPRHLVDQPVPLIGRVDRPMRWFTFSWTPLRHEAGEVAGFYCVATETTERMLAEQTLSDDYRLLFESIDDGFVIFDLLFDANGRPFDIRYVKTNPSFHEHLGIRPEPGQTLLELHPDVEDHWFETYAQVLRSGEGKRFSDASPAFGRWFDVYVFPVGGAGSDRLAALFSDVSERKRAELALQESEEQQGFLLELSDALRDIADPLDLQTAAMTLVARRFDAVRAFFYTVDPDHDGVTLAGCYNGDATPMPAHLRLSDFGDAVAASYRAGRPFVVTDIETDPRIAAHRDAYRPMGMRALVGVPLLTGSQVRAALGVHRLEPHAWTSRELRLLDEIAERLSAAVEQARAEAALRESEERHAYLLQLSDALRPLSDPDAIQHEAMQHLGRRLGVNRAQYYTADDTGEYLSSSGGYTDGVDAAVGRFRLVEFGQYAYDGFHAGQTQVVCDATTDPRISEAVLASYRSVDFLAYIGVPFVQGGRLLGSVAVHQTTPRQWTALEQRMVEETAERAGLAIEHARAERARRESEAKYAALFAASPVPVMVVAANPPDYTITAANAAYFAATHTTPETLIGRRLFDVFPDDPCRAGQLGSDALALSLARVLRTRTTDAMERVRYDLLRPDGGFEPHWWLAINAPLLDAAGNVSAIIHQVDRQTEQHEAEEAERARQVVQAFLLRLSDALRPLSDPVAIKAAASRLLAEHLGVDRAMYSEFTGEGRHRMAHIVGQYVRDGEPFPSPVPYDAYIDGELARLLASGGALVVNDAAHETRFGADVREAWVSAGIASMVALGLVKDGREVAHFGFHHGVPRNWTPSDIALVREVAERTWAAVARAQTEDALRESEERFRQFGDASSDVLWIVDAETGQLEYLSPAFERVWGISRAPVMADMARWVESLHPDDRDIARSALPQALRGIPTTVDYRIVRPDGEVRYITDVGFPIIAPDGRVTRVGGIAQDRTERREYEQALRDSEERQRLMVELVPALLWSASPDGREVTVNEARTAYTGQTEAETQNYGWLDAIHPDDRPATQAAFMHAFATGEPLERQQRIRKVGDGWRWHLVRHVPVRDDSGAIIRWFGAAVDIHESKLAEQALDASERRLQMLVEGVPQLVWRAVDNGHWTWASPQWNAYTGQSDAESHGDGWLDPVHPDDRERVRLIWQHAVARGEFHADYRICHAAEHRYRWFQTRATPVRDDAGRIVEWLGTSTDVDDLRQLQERQQVLVSELQHRTFNLMSMVRSTADATVRSSHSLEEFQTKFRDRVAALARVQRLLSRLTEDDRVTFDELIRGELDAVGALHEPGRVHLDGPDGVALRSRTVQTFAMAIHELATNAMKYGALAQPGAHLDLRWHVDAGDGGEPWLHLD